MAAQVREAGKRGVNAAVPLTGVGTLADYATAPLPPLPATVPVPSPAGGWGMDGNDLYGDCVAAGAGHAIAAWATILTSVGLGGDAPAIPNSDQVITWYKQQTGCQEPGDANDTGLNVNKVLDEWQKDGIFGTKILGATHVPFTAHQHIRQAIALTGAVVLAVNLPDSAEAQFEQGTNWVYTGDKGTGGHEMVMVGYDGLWIQAVTWGEVVNLGPRWISHYGVGAYCPLPVAYQQAGRGLENIDFAAVQRDMPALA